MRRPTAMWAVVIALLAAPAPATAQTVAEAVEQVTAADAHRYAAVDDRGAPLDALDIIEAPTGYLGVHHTIVGDRFELALVSSTDLTHWTHRAVLDTDASQGTLAAVPGGGFVVAYEWGHTIGRLPLTRMPEGLEVVNGLIDRISLRFRYYPSLERLLAGRPARSYTAPRRLALTAEGTPSFSRLQFGGGPRRSRLDLGLHYFADDNGDPFPDVDRQATGTLRGFRRWSAQPADALNQSFLALTDLHEGFSAAPTGNFGDRDEVRADGRTLVVHEAQYRRGDFATWRLFLRDPSTGSITPLHPRTHGGSTAFGNPSVSELRLPDGRRGLVVSAFVFGEGAAPGEAGPLLYVRATG